ncbi:MAG: DUF1285 domain-containing protein [Deltaproteobacteria bacterium]|nr:MAG: DUF1285 domain-containing protein [Deltaproteobacteria bacterium]
MGGHHRRVVRPRSADAAIDRPNDRAAWVERLRQTGIRIDREGRLWHEGEEIRHEGLRRALLRWLDRLDDGRRVLRLDAERYAYVDVEDADLIATSARWEGDRAWIRTNDGAEEELDYGTLRVGAGDALYCAVRGGRLVARIATPAYYALAQRIEETPHGFALRANGRLYPLADGTGSSQ